MEISDEGGSAADAQLKACSADAFRDGDAPDAFRRAYLPSHESLLQHHNHTLVMIDERSRRAITFRHSYGYAPLRRMELIALLSTLKIVKIVDDGFQLRGASASRNS